MDKRGEMEIRINTRMVERAIFAVVILVLIVLYFTKSAPGTAGLQANVTSLTKQLSDKSSEVQQLQSQLEKLNNTTNNTQPQATITATSPPAPVQNTTTLTSPACTGRVDFSWNSTGEMLVPIQYNADQITSVQGNISDLSAQLNSTNNTNLRENLQSQIDDLNHQLSSLRTGDPKYNVDNVTVTISNGEDSPTPFSYLMCWLSLDCSVVHTEGTINMQSCSNRTTSIDFTNLPHKISVPMGNQQTLRLTISDANDNVLFKDDKTFSSSLS